ncbi:MAG: hypothetical protein ABI604_03110 [Nitrospirota bacterium]
MIIHKRWLIALAGLAVMVAAGCSGQKVTTKSSTELPRYQIRTIALVQFTTLATPQVRDVAEQTLLAPPEVRRSDISIAVTPHAEQPLRQTVTVPAGAGDIVTQLLWSQLKSRQGVTVLSPHETAKALASPLLPKLSVGQSPAVTVANLLKADASLIGQVLVYQERVGGRFGASPPAMVGFEAKVVAADGQVLWEGNYYEKQRPMTEDLMGFIQRRGVFVTAEELAAYGVEHMLNEFPFGTVVEH